MKRNLLYIAKALGLGLALAATSCSGPNINKDLFEDKTVLVRQWTMPTHGPFEAGDRGVEFSNPVLHENTLIFGNRSVGLISIYPEFQQARWSLPIPGGVVGEILIDQSKVYFGGADGFLYSVDAETGNVLWRYDIHNPVISRPTIHLGRILVTTADDTVFALDAGTGKWLWHYRRRTSPPATIYGASAPLVLGSEVVTGLSDGFLVGINLDDGKLKWEKRLHTGNKFVDVDAHPVFADGIIYISSYDGSLYALKKDGQQVIWRFDAGGSKQVVLEGDRIFFPSSDGAIYALNKESAKVIWKFNLDKGSPTQLTVTDRHILVGSSYQYFYVLDKATGKGLYRYNVGFDSGFYGASAFNTQKQQAYILSSAGNLMSFTVRQPLRKVRPRGSTDGYLW